ncbi:MAG TPA: hydrogenase maturation protease [Kofleriaceae bacterium]|nr:hydrogenase maturation protease [Kofleriaceae bacterium]
MKILVAGIGNVLLGDDGFGPAVIAALRAGGPRTRPDVEIADFGIRGMDLALALTGGVDAAILVDAVARGGAPGTLYVIEPAAGAPPELLAHAMDPARVLAYAAAIGAPPRVVRVVGCEPARLGDGEGDGDRELLVGLSEPVARAVAPAARLVGDLVAALAEGACTS